MAVSPSNLATFTCQYKDEPYDFRCDEPARDTGSKFCIFHDINYVKDDNYDKHKEEVARRFEKKLSEYSSKDRPVEFRGYCLPDVSFSKHEFTEQLSFSGARFYGVASFHRATFSKEVFFSGATFFKETGFHQTTFFKETYFQGTALLGLADFQFTKFEDALYFTNLFHIFTLSNVSDYLSKEFVHFSTVIATDTKPKPFNSGQGNISLWGLDGVIYCLNVLKRLMHYYYGKLRQQKKRKKRK